MELSTHLWRVPSIETAFEGWLEGLPTEAQRQSILERTVQERQQWIPSAEAWAQLEAVRACVGRRVQVQLYDIIIVILAEDEGPYPITATCLDVVTRTNDEGITEAYLLLEGVECHPTEDGYDGRAKYLRPVGTEGGALVNLGDLYSIRILDLPSTCRTS